MDPVLTIPQEPPQLTLGWGVLQWCSTFLRQPDGPDAGTPWRFTPEQVLFVLHWYAVDSTGRYLANRGVLRRSKGWGKSPLVASLALAELCGPVRFSHFDNTQAVGRPVPAAWVQLAGVSEKQTVNTMSMVTGMVAESPILTEYGLDVGLTRIYTANGGRLEPITASAPSAEGARPTACIADETHWWTSSNGGHKLDQVMRRNLGKSRDGAARMLETTNAHAIGLDSVAERSHQAWEQMQSGQAHSLRMLYDSREAPPDIDLGDLDQLKDAIAAAYGDSYWIDPARIMDEALDPATPPNDSRRFYLNQIADADSSLFAAFEWASCLDTDKIVADKDAVTLGFDGSRGRVRGKPDATALIGCRVADGHLFEIGVWEAAEGPHMEDWTPPIPEIEAAVANAFRTWNVVGFYADPARDWRSHVNKWEADFGGKIEKKMRVKPDHPFEWWMTGGRSGLIQLAVEAFEGAVRNQDLTHDGSFKLTQHILNSRREIRSGKLRIGKENDYSPKKVDAAVAAVLAWQARCDAVAAGVNGRRRSRKLTRY